MTDRGPKSAQWAKDVILQLEEARDHMIEARSLMRASAAMIAHDSNEAQAAEDVVGALNLTIREVCLEVHKWIGFAAYRSTQRRPQLVEVTQ